MPVLFVSQKHYPIVSIPFVAKSNLFSVLALYEHTRVRSACLKKGTCALCLVRIDDGEVSPLTRHEQQRLSTRQIKQGIRFACQVRLETDTYVTLINPLQITALDTLPIDSPLPNARYAVAMDLGSTQIRISLWDMVNQQRIATYCCFNPQAYYGTDILNRLSAAALSENDLQQMSSLILSIIDRIVRDWSNTKNVIIEKILIVGNSAMLALLAKKHCSDLLEPHFWTQTVDYSLDIKLLGQIPISVVQAVAGFIGSDLLAGVWATALTQSANSALLIDFGTNSEIALWHNGRLWLTSVPGGPAFEGCGISCGIAAEAGAVAHIRYDAIKQIFNGTILGDTEEDIKGLCGSALCDLMACLLTAGLLKKNGRFAEPINELEIELTNLSYCFTVKKSDIDVFQRAKAATGAGVAGLLQAAGAQLSDIKRVCVAGSFGQFLTIPYAQAIGLLPDCAPEKIELCANTALLGCEKLLDSSVAEQLDDLRYCCYMINMAQLANYDELFVDNLYLQTLRLQE